MQWGPETQPLVEGPQAWLSSGGRRGKEELGWTESTRFGTCTTPPPSLEPHLALPLPK